MRFYDCKQDVKVMEQLPDLCQLQHQEGYLLSELGAVSKFVEFTKCRVCLSESYRGDIESLIYKMN